MLRGSRPLTQDGAILALQAALVSDVAGHAHPEDGVLDGRVEPRLHAPQDEESLGLVDPLAEDAQLGTEVGQGEKLLGEITGLEFGSWRLSRVSWATIDSDSRLVGCEGVPTDEFFHGNMELGQVFGRQAEDVVALVFELRALPGNGGRLGLCTDLDARRGRDAGEGCGQTGRDGGSHDDNARVVWSCWSRSLGGDEDYY